MDKFRDVAYTFEFDNPFENDSQRINCNQLITFIKSNPSIFLLDDYINKPLYISVDSSIVGIYGRRIDDNITKNPIMKDIKDFLEDFHSDIPSTLQSWLGQEVKIEEVAEEEDDEEEEEENTEGNTEGDNKDDNKAFNPKEIIKLNKNKYAYSMTGGITNYDISSDKLLGITQIRELSVNIARSLLVKDVQGDLEIQKLETKKRKDLIVQIQKYKNIKKIAALLDDDIIDMSIDQLEICLEQCKKYHETFKLQEVIKSSFNGGKVLFNAFLPNGIKVGKKRIKMGGIGEELISTLFDSTTVIGKSFDNIAQKYNFHINDDALVILKIVETMIKGVKIEDVPDETPKDVFKMNVQNESKPIKSSYDYAMSNIKNNNISRIPENINPQMDNYNDAENEEEEDYYEEEDQ